MSTIERFESMLESGQDSHLLRFSLGSEYLKLDQPERAISHLSEAVRQNPEHSASWKLLGKALSATERYSEALIALDQGLIVAEEQGDKQALKEMQVFRRRAEKALQAS